MIQRLRSVIGVVFAIQVAGGVLAYVTQVVLARWMGAEQYGFYAYCVAWSTVLSIVAASGTAASAVKFVPVYLRQGRSGALAGFLRASRIAVSVGVVLACALGWMLYAVGFLAVQPTLLLPCLLIAVPLGFLLLSTQVARSVERPVLAFAPEQVLRQLLLLGGAAWLVRQGELTARGTLVVLFVALSLLGVVQAVVVARDLRARLAGAAPEVRWREWLAVSNPLLAINVLLFLMVQSDILMLGYFESGQAVGIYNAAVKTAILTQFGLNAVNAAVAPRIAALHAERRTAEIQRLATKTSRVVFAFASLVTVVFLVGGRQILGLFGEAFTQAYVPLVILAVGRLGATSFGVVMNLMNMTGNQRASAFVLAGAAVLNLGLNTALIPLLGASGAALATAIATVAGHVAQWLLVRRRLGVDAFLLGGTRG